MSTKRMGTQAEVAKVVGGEKTAKRENVMLCGADILRRLGGLPDRVETWCDEGDVYLVVYRGRTPKLAALVETCPGGGVDDLYEALVGDLDNFLGEDSPRVTEAIREGDTEYHGLVRLASAYRRGQRLVVEVETDRMESSDRSYFGLREE